MFCENCGSPLQDEDRICPKCGRVVEENMPVRRVTPAPNAAANTGAAVNAENASVYTETVKPGKKSKKGKGKIIALSVVAAVLVLFTVVGVMNAAKINNLIHSFAAPEKYYAYVEQQSVEQASDLLAVQYAGDLSGIYVFNMARHLLQDGEINMDFDFTLGEGSKDLMDMAKASGVDLSWIQNGKVTARFGMKGNTFIIGTDADINGTDLISANMIADMDQDGLYLQIPELSGSYLGMTDMGLYDPQISDALTMVRDVLNECPDQEQVETIAAQYATVAITSIQTVTKEIGYELTVADITQKCTKLEVALTEENWKAVFDALAREAEEDTALRELVVNICNAAGEADGTEVYDSFLEALKMMKDNYNSEYSSYVMRVFVDNEGTIRGRELELPGSAYEYISYKMPVKGSNFGLAFSVQQDGTLVTVDGIGKFVDDTMDGTYVIGTDDTDFMEMKICETTFDSDAAKAGMTNGKIEMSFAPEAKDLINQELDDSYGEYSGIIAKMLSEFKVSVDVNRTPDSVMQNAVLYFGEEVFMTADCTVSAAEASEIKIPEEGAVVLAHDDEAVMAYMTGIDWDGLTANFEKMNMPQEYLDVVESAVAMMSMYDMSSMYDYDMEDSEESYNDPAVDEIDWSDYNMDDLSEEELEQLNALMEM